MENNPERKLWVLFRDPISGLTHLGGAVLGFFGLVILLIINWENWLAFTANLIYGITLVLMFSASASYHMVKAGPTSLQRLRKFDHSAIYLLIAGSYTPMCLITFEGFWSWGMLTIIWLMAVAGVIVKLFVINAPRWVTAGVYLVMGWISIFAVQEMLRSLSLFSLSFMIVGGLFYSIGAIVYIRKKPDPLPGIFGFHEIWHIFVLLGAFAHFAAIAGL